MECSESLLNNECEKKIFFHEKGHNCKVESMNQTEE